MTHAVHSVTLNGRELDPAEVSDGVRIQLPDLAAENELTGGGGRPLHEHRRRPAPLRGSGGQRGVPVHPVRGAGLAPDVRRLRTARPQGQLPFTVTAPSHWDVVSNSPTPVPEETIPGERRRRPLRLGLHAHAAAVLLRHRADRRTVPVGAQRGHQFATAASSRWASSPASRSCSTWTRTTSSSSPGRASSSSRPSSAARTRSRSTTSSSCRSSTPAPWRTPGRSPSWKATSSAARSPDAQVERRAITVLHELAHMWFGDLVTMRWWNDLWLNESFAEYMSHLAAVENTKFDQRLDHVRLGGEVLGLPPGPAAHHAPDLRRDQRPAGRRGELRRHHLRQGRLGAAPAGGLGGAGAVHGRRARVLQPSTPGRTPSSAT